MSKFNLSKLKQDTNKGTPRFIRYAYAEEDVKEFIRLLKTEFVLKGYNMADKYAISPKEIYEIINKLAGNKLVKENLKDE